MPFNLGVWKLSQLRDVHFTTESQGDLLVRNGRWRRIPAGTPGQKLSVSPSEPDLALHLPFSEGAGATAGDASGNGNNGSISGAGWSAGRFGNALYFDGSTADEVYVPPSASLNISMAITLAAWVYSPLPSSGDYVIMEKSWTSHASPYYLYLLSILAPNLLRFDLGIGGANVGRYGGAISPNAWTHLAATYDGANMKIYINGSQAGTWAQTGSIDMASTPLYIGRHGNLPTLDRFKGTIDEVRVYSRALSPSEIQDLMHWGEVRIGWV